MPFIVQCPHPECRRYMLLEDSARGSQVECLVCKRRIDVDASGSGDRLETPPPHPESSRAPSQATLPAQRQKILNCPQCQSPLRVPPGHEGKPLKCPRCGNVFKP